MHRFVSFRPVLFLALASTLAACGDDPSHGSGPGTGPSISLHVPAGLWYPGDVATLGAKVRDASGELIPDAAVTWSASDPARVEISPAGVATFLAPGSVTITARYQSARTERVIDVRPLTVQLVSIQPGTLELRRGDGVVLGIRVRGEGGRDVLGRSVTITSDDPTIAFIDAAGRLHSLRAGSTTVRAAADGVSGTARVDVADQPATLSLSRVGGARLPLLVAADSVWWDGERRYHEIFIEGGDLVLTGDADAGYTIDVRFAEYDVSAPEGQRVYRLIAQSLEHDFGKVYRDARGDLRMLSAYSAPLQHTATVVSGGIAVHYRIPGSDNYLDLLYRRE